MCVDGKDNFIEEVNVEIESDEKVDVNKNSFFPKYTILKNEKDAVRDCNSKTSRYWKVNNSKKKNSYSTPTGLLIPYFSIFNSSKFTSYLLLC
jgi:Cu2+-containing amine oxidase